MKKKILLIPVIAILLTGCTSKTASGEKISTETDTSSLKGTLVCSRNGTGLEGASVGLDYEIEYKNGYIIKLSSEEKVSSTSSEILDQYEEAYRNVFSVYDGIEYYTNEVTRDELEVVSDTVIEYDKVDIDKIIAIEGNQEGFYENGKMSLDKWLEFAEKFGTVCYEK